MRDAHETFARSGDEALKEELVRLLTERSAQPTGTRKALVLNEAIRIAGSLTRQEYAALAAILLFRYSTLDGSPAGIMTRLKRFISDFIDDLPEDDNSYDYLESMRCISVNSLGSASFWNILWQVYSVSLSYGFTNEELRRAIGDNYSNETFQRLVVPALAHIGGNIRFNVRTPELLREKFKEVGLGAEVTDKAVELFERTRRSEEDIKAEFEGADPNFPRLAALWSNTALGKANLTALGKALAHSALVSRTDFEAPLEVWVS